MSADADKTLQLFSKTSEEIRKQVVEILGQNRTAPNFILLMTKIFETASALNDSVFEQGDSSPALACRAGCDHCCANAVVMTQPAYAIFALVTARAQDGGKAYEHAVKQLRLGEPGCQFLQNSSCMIYAGRPLVCRVYHSFDEVECRDFKFLLAAHATNIGDIAVSDGLLTGLRELGLDCEEIYLSKAIELLATTDGVVERWLAGEDVFAPYRSQNSASWTSPTDSELTSSENSFFQSTTKHQRKNFTH